MVIMRRLLVFIGLMIFTTSLCSAQKKPIILLFPVQPGTGAASADAVEATAALKTYFRETGKSEIADFDKESPLVLRAVREGKLSESDLVGVPAPEARLSIGKILGVDMVAAGDVGIKDGSVSVSLWLGDVATTRIWKNAASASIGTSGDLDKAKSNALQSAASTVVYAVAAEALKDVKVSGGDASGGGAVVTPSDFALPPPDVGTYLTTAELYVRSGDLANAIESYRDAVNADPTNLDIRLRLAQLYEKRRLFTQAADELERAVGIDPSNQKLRDELASVYEQMGALDKAAAIYTNIADKNPSDVRARLAAGDFFLKHKAYDDAEKQYRLAIEAAPTDPSPYERLADMFVLNERLSDAAKEIGNMQRADPNADANTISARYAKYSKAAVKVVDSVLSDYDKLAAQYSDKKITREEYYEQLRKDSAKVEGARLVFEVLAAPVGSSPANKSRVLACSLISQACTSMMRYLETNKDSEKLNAEILLDEARRHLASAEGK